MNKREKRIVLLMLGLCIYNSSMSFKLRNSNAEYMRQKWLQKLEQDPEEKKEHGKFYRPKKKCGIRKRYLLTPPEYQELEIRTRYRRAHWPAGVTKPTKWIGGILKDIYMLNANIFSWDSFKIIASVFPFFIATRMLDEKVQKHFYRACCHKNVHQMPKWCSELGKYGIGIPIGWFGINAFVSRDEEFSTTCRIFLIGMPFVIWTKELIKKAKFDACYRPWSQKFSSKKRSPGGFPSGHMAEATYTAVLFGLRYGPKAAIPLGSIAFLIAVSFINCNRHYSSQIIGGIGFGAMYALAGHKLINAKLDEKKMELAMGYDNGPAVQFSYKF